MNATLSSNGMQKPVVYVIDDDASMRDALEDLLTSVDLDVISFGSTRALLDHGIAQAPACLVLDIRMPGQSGLDFQRDMTRLGLRLPVIFITGHGDIEMSVRAMKDGAIEFLSKPFRDQDLLDAIHEGIKKDALRRADDNVSAELRERWLGLTAGEQDVMRLVVCGHMNKQIAGALAVSEITVKVRRSQVMRKMRARNLADLIRMFDRLQHQELNKILPVRS